MKIFLKKNTASLIFGFTSSPFFVRGAYYGDDAYDRYQLVSYANEIYKIREKKKKDFSEIELILFDLIVFSKFTNLTELGSTLGSLLDKFELYNSSKSTSLNYIGIEPLPILANFSKYLHENKNFEVVDSFEKISPSQREINFCIMSHTYAFKSTEELIEYIDSFRISVDIVYFSLNNKHEYYESFGDSSASVFDFKNFLEKISKKKKVFLLNHGERMTMTGFKLTQVYLISIDNDLAKVIDRLKENKDLVLLPNRISINKLSTIKKPRKDPSVVRGNILTRLAKGIKLLIRLNLPKFNLIKSRNY